VVGKKKKKKKKKFLRGRVSKSVCVFAYVEYGVCAEALDEVVVAWRGDCDDFVPRKVKKLDRRIPNSSTPSINKDLVQTKKKLHINIKHISKSAMSNTCVCAFILLLTQVSSATRSGGSTNPNRSG
jgi:hypothetical protein